MSSLIPARRRAEEFAVVLDRLDAGDVEDLRDSELVAYTAVVTGLRDHGAVPRPEFTDALRDRLMAEAEVALKRQDATLLLPVRQRGARERRLVAAASAMVLIGGTTTIAAAAHDSLPGEALYPVKRGLERAEVGLNTSEAGKGHDLLDQAEARLTEVDGLLTSDSPLSRPRIPETLADFSVQADAGAERLFESFEQTQDPESVRTVRSFALEAIDKLTQLADDVPPSAQNELVEAAAILQQIDEEAAGLCNRCMSDVPVVEVPDVFLARADVDRVLQEISGQPVDDSHPVTDSKDSVDQPEAEKADKDASASKPKRQDVFEVPRDTQPKEPASTPSLTPPAPSPGDPEPSPSDPLTGLPPVPDGNVSGETGGSPEQDPKKKLEQESEKPTKDLGNAVETILPDPVATGLLPED